MLLALIPLAACRGPTEPPAPHPSPSPMTGDSAEYQLLMTELKLAQTPTPYLVLNLQRRQIELRLNGEVVWNQGFTDDPADSLSLRRFIRHFQAVRPMLIRPLKVKRLFAYQERIADTLLTIVSAALSVKPELLQRELPSHFRLIWGDGIGLDVRSDAEGRMVRKLPLQFYRLRDDLLHLLGQPRLVIHLPAEQALTLYRAVFPGMPTMLLPPRP